MPLNIPQGTASTPPVRQSVEHGATNTPRGRADRTLKPRLIELPHLQGESEDIDELLTDVKGLSQEQETLRGRLKEITRLRREAERRGTELRSRGVAQLKGKLGFTNENLLAYGITPHKRDRKKPTPKKAPPAAATQDTESGSSSTEQ